MIRCFILTSVSARHIFPSLCHLQIHKRLCVLWERLLCLSHGICFYKKHQCIWYQQGSCKRRRNLSMYYYCNYLCIRALQNSPPTSRSTEIVRQMVAVRRLVREVWQRIFGMGRWNWVWVDAEEWPLPKTLDPLGSIMWRWGGSRMSPLFPNAPREFRRRRQELS